MRSLLDVNLVIALLDSDHDFHDRAHDWWAEAASAGWASCPIIENGAVRIMSNPVYNPKRTLSPKDVIDALQRFADGTDHEFWPDSVSLLESGRFNATTILGHKQITDLYLAALAVDHGGRFTTFDGSINRSAVIGIGDEHLLVI